MGIPANPYMIAAGASRKRRAETSAAKSVKARKTQAGRLMRSAASVGGLTYHSTAILASKRPLKHAALPVAFLTLQVAWRHVSLLQSKGPYALSSTKLARLRMLMLAGTPSIIHCH